MTSATTGPHLLLKILLAGERIYQKFIRNLSARPRKKFVEPVLIR